MRTFITKAYPHSQIRYGLPWIAMDCHGFFFRTPSFRIQGVTMNNLTPMKNCPGGGGGVQDAGVILYFEYYKIHLLF